MKAWCWFGPQPEYVCVCTSSLGRNLFLLRQLGLSAVMKGGVLETLPLAAPLLIEPKLHVDRGLRLWPSCMSPLNVPQGFVAWGFADGLISEGINLPRRQIDVISCASWHPVG